MSIRINSIVLVLATSFAVVGCSSSNNKTDGENETSSPGPGNNGGSNNVTAFDGNWVEPCEGEPGDYTVVSYVINGGSATSTEDNYTDANCTMPGIPAVVVTEVSLTYPGGTTTTRLGEATHVNIMLESVTTDGMAPTDEEQAMLVADGFYNTEYDLFLVDGSNLYAGEYTEELDGTTAEKRPVTLESVVFAVRQ